MEPISHTDAHTTFEQAPPLNESIIDLYSLDSIKAMCETCGGKATTPFKHMIHFKSQDGSQIHVEAMFDGGAMVGAMDSLVFAHLKDCLAGQWQPSRQKLRMANGVVL